MYKVIGLRVEKYLGQTCSGHNCDFDYGEEERDRHVILLKHRDTGEKVELTLSWFEDSCGSGWCTSTEAEADWNNVNTFAGATHTIKEETYLDISCGTLAGIGEGTHTNTIFEITPYGCMYYPHGGYDVDMTMFQEDK